jgi:hypothetical protein
VGTTTGGAVTTGAWALGVAVMMITWGASLVSSLPLENSQAESMSVTSKAITIMGK